MCTAMTKRFFLCLLVFLAISGSAVATKPSWEEMQQPASVERVEQEQIEIYTRDGYVYINTPQPVTVKIFSILGQLISQENVPAGTFRLRLASRGIYILKAGTITRRITI